MRAAARGHLEVVKFLVGKGSDVNAKGYNSVTSLMLATNASHPDVVEFLKQHGAKK